MLPLMIARHWRGWTKPQNADHYENLLTKRVFPTLENIEGYFGGYVLRSDGATECEFIVVSFFESLEAVKRFAGPDYAVPVFEPEAKTLLSRVEERANHYAVRIATKGPDKTIQDVAKPRVLLQSVTPPFQDFSRDLLF